MRFFLPYIHLRFLIWNGWLAWISSLSQTLYSIRAILFTATSFSSLLDLIIHSDNASIYLYQWPHKFESYSASSITNVIITALYVIFWLLGVVGFLFVSFLEDSNFFSWNTLCKIVSHIGNTGKASVWKTHLTEPLSAVSHCFIYLASLPLLFACYIGVSHLSLHVQLLGGSWRMRPTNQWCQFTKIESLL